MGSQQPLIVPDYAMPAALLVPHYDTSIRQTLEQTARIASNHIGVILLSVNPSFTQRFLDAQGNADHYTVITGSFDTPWVRDRSPVATDTPQGICWILPRMPPDDREHDQTLFQKICAHSFEHSRLTFAQGNLVAGPNGVVLSTTRLLEENELQNTDGLKELKAQLGIEHWILFEPFHQEQTGHADVHARFLGPNLLVTAWNDANILDQAKIERLEAQVDLALPGIEIIRLPLWADKDRYASPVNWIQLGDVLLVPRYRETPDSHCAQIKALLDPHGIQTYFNDSINGGTH
jgi:agmatine/peptidylarginine deiminase